MTTLTRTSKEDKAKLEFYAISVNGSTATLHVSRSKAVSEMNSRLTQGDTDVRIKKLNSLKDFIDEYCYFEDVDDDEWVEFAIRNTVKMIDEARKSEK